ncbi:YciI family protein [Amycolatopsis sp. FDAARGOS 1241]|uniref:YciI family protein n=1 Tax=Amycolatopsis sp. FDAARGOS 1241 TaxID=2778070 RepID=UPI0019520AE5|nr:YciI family protein [Amycolatopsis sp. FDAARGOS 1241]QRP49943.1 transcription initiation protein [Amycolatopsis sp. FDAARGOS 1241]
MRYLLMIAGEEPTEEQKIAGCGGWSDDLLTRGILVGGGGLHPPATATTVRVRGGDVLLSDGPFTESKEQIGGYAVIECGDLDEAVDIAARHPAAAYGTIEVRPML